MKKLGPNQLTSSVQNIRSQTVGKRETQLKGVYEPTAAQHLEVARENTYGGAITKNESDLELYILQGKP